MSVGARRRGRVLRTAVTEHDWSVPAPGIARSVERRPLGDLVTAASRHGVAAALYLSIRGLDVDPEAMRLLEAAHRDGVAGHLRATADLSWVAGVLGRITQRWLVIKGPVLAETVYARPELRSYGDLDVVVEPAAFAEVVTALEGGGAHVIDRNWDLARDEQRGQVHLSLPFGTVLDLHWHLVNRAAVRSSLAVPTGDLFDRARTVRVEPLDVPTLDPVDTLLHVAVHAALAGGEKLQWTKDVERAASVLGDRWDDVVRRARAWGAAPPVGSMLRRAQLIGLELPDDVPRALVGSRPARVVDRAITALWPPGTDVARLPALWLRTHRDSARVTLRVAADRYRASHHGGDMLDPGGDEATREAYLAGIADDAERRS